MDSIDTKAVYPITFLNKSFFFTNLCFVYKVTRLTTNSSLSSMGKLQISCFFYLR